MCIKNKYYSIILIFFLLVSFSVRSQNTSENDSLLNLTLEELLDINISTASRISKTEQRTPAVISSYSKSDIEKMGVTSFIDILNFVPSIETSLGPNGSYRVSLRGKRQDGIILCLLNGQVMNNPYDGSIYYDIPYEQIQKIEIIRGSGSAIYGNNAALGVINIITNKTNNDISVKAGTNGIYGANTNMCFKTFESDIYFNLGYYESNGPKEFINTDNSSDSTWSLTYRNKKYDINRTSKNYYFNSGIERKGLAANFNGFSNQHSSYTGSNLLAAPKSIYKNNQILGNIKYNYLVTKKITLTPEFFGTYLNQNNSLKETPLGFVSETGNLFSNGKIQKTDYNIFTYGSQLTSRFEISERINFIIGNIYKRQVINSFKVNRNYTATTPADIVTLNLFNKNRVRSIFAYFFEADIKLQKFSFLAGGRLDSYSDFGQSINPRVSLIYNPNKENYFKILYGTAFRAPTFKELYDPSNLGLSGIKGNPDLSPQIISSLEFEYGFIKNNIRFKTNLFTNNFNKLISSIDTMQSQGQGIYENLGFTESFGANFEIKIPITKKINIGSNLSIVKTYFYWADNLKSEYFDYIETAGRRELTNIPQVRFNGMIDYTNKKWIAFLGINYGGSAKNNLTTQKEEDADEVKIPEYVLMNGSLSYKPTSKITIKLAVNNIGGNKYSDPDQSSNIGVFGTNGLIQPSETYTISIKYKFNQNKKPTL